MMIVDELIVTLTFTSMLDYILRGASISDRCVYGKRKPPMCLS